MNQIKGLSLATPLQKSIAAIVGVGFLVFLYFFIWPLVYSLLGLMAFIVLAGILLFLGYNYKSFYNFFEAMSMRMTNRFIGFTKIEQHEIYYNHVLNEYNGIVEALNKFNAGVIEDERKLIKKKESLRFNSEQALRVSSKGPEYERAALEFSEKARIDKAVIANLEPRYESNKKVSEELGMMEKDKATKLKTLRYSIDTEIEEYESWKRNNNTTKAISKFMSEDSAEARRFKEACKQTEQEITAYIAEYDSFSRKSQPIINAAKANQEISLDQSRLFLEELKAQKQITN